MGQATAYSGQYTDCTEQQTEGTYYVIDECLAILQSGRNLYEYAQEHHHDKKQQHHVPVIGQ